MLFAVSAISQPYKRELCEWIYSSIYACILNFAHVFYDKFIRVLSLKYNFVEKHTIQLNQMLDPLNLSGSNIYMYSNVFNIEKQIHAF